MTAEEIRFLETFGYLLVRGALATGIERIEDAFEERIAALGGAAYRGQHRFTVDPGVNGSRALCEAVLDDEGLDALAASLLGADYQYVNSDLNLCGGDTPWHSDAPADAAGRYAGWYKLLVYLDPLERGTGALRVIPGSHRRSDRYAADVQGAIVNRAAGALADPAETWGVAPEELPAVALATRPGDVIVLDYRVAHASFGGPGRRRLLTVWLARRLAAQDRGLVSRVFGGRRFTRGELFGDAEMPAPILDGAPASRLVHLQELLASFPEPQPDSPLTRFLESGTRGHETGPRAEAAALTGRPDLRFAGTFGYLKLPGILADGFAEVERVFEELLGSGGDGLRTGAYGVTLSPGVNRSEALCRLVLDDPRVARVLDALVGEDWQYWNSALSRNEGDTPWHFEAPPVEWTVYAGWFKLLFYLDPLDGGTGALRAIPGSNHWNDSYAGDVRHGLMNESGTAPIDPRAAWGVAGPEVPAVALDSRPGDAIALSYLTAHASFGGRTRRLLSLVFAPRSARSEAPRYRGLTRRDVFGEENAPFPLIATATPERRRHLERLLEHTSEDPSPLARFLAR